MKGIQSLVFLVLGVAVIVNAFPSERDVESVEDDAEDYVPISSVPAIPVPTDTEYGYNPSFFSFFPDFDLVSRIRGLVTKLRSQIGDSFGNIDWNKGNTTSTTKVIDGHIVTVNETSYKDDDTDLVLHVKVIDVKPTEGEVPPSGDDSENDVALPAVSGEDTEKNEIPNKPEEDAAESLEHNNQPEETREHVVETREYLPHDYLYNIDRPVEEVENEIEENTPIEFQPIRLDNDIRVNQIMQDKGGMVMVPDDVEIFEPDNRDLYVVNENNEYVYNPMPIYQSAPNARFPHRPRSEKLTSLT